MSELQTQLRDYFDDVVERVGVQDVIAQVHVRRQPRLRGPVRAAVTAAAAVFVGVGSVVVALWLLQGGPRLYRSSGAPVPTTTDASWVLPALIGVAAVLALGALGVFVSWGSRRGEGMETIEKTAKLRIEPGKTNRWLIVALVVLLVAIAAGAAWFLLSSPVPSDVQALLDDYIAAWNAHDGDAVLATIGTGMHVSSAGTFNGARLASFVDSMPSGWTATMTTPPSGSSPALFLLPLAGEVAEARNEPRSMG
ncbi:MAG: hypothetical protein GXP34_09875 [Actinobacteria bacterium]|nr:hypothetical protein [Actinomycetota bacterium]